jgi:hypothetical protein
MNFTRNTIAFQGYTVPKAKRPSPHVIKMAEKAADKDFKEYVVTLKSQHEKLCAQCESWISKLTRENSKAVAMILAEIFRELHDDEKRAFYRNAAIERLREILRG